jgi:hypothetical protein
VPLADGATVKMSATALELILLLTEAGAPPAAGQTEISGKGMLGDATGGPVDDEENFLSNRISRIRSEEYQSNHFRIRLVELPGMAEHLRDAEYTATQGGSSWRTSGCDVILGNVDPVNSKQASNLREFLKRARLILVASVSPLRRPVNP